MNSNSGYRGIFSGWSRKFIKSGVGIVHSPLPPRTDVLSRLDKPQLSPAPKEHQAGPGPQSQGRLVPCPGKSVFHLILPRNCCGTFRKRLSKPRASSPAAEKFLPFPLNKMWQGQGQMGPLKKNVTYISGKVALIKVSPCLFSLYLLPLRASSLPEQPGQPSEG